MPIKLPDFKEAHLFWITVCAEIPSVDTELEKWMKDAPTTMAQYQAFGGDGQIVMMLGGGSGKHIHFDVFSPHMSLKKMRGKPAKIDQIQESADRFLGKEAEANIVGGFKIKLEELPENGIVRSLFFQTKMGNVAIKLDGAKFAIEGAPIQSISWNSAAKGNFNISLEADLVKTMFSENYLTDSINLLEQAFNIFVLGKVQNESKS